MPELTHLAPEVTFPAPPNSLEHFVRLAPRLLIQARRALVRLGFQSADADDIAQAAFADAATGLGSFRGQSDGEFSSWFNTILHRRRMHDARTEQRRRQRTSDFSLDRAMTATHLGDVQQETFNELSRAMQRLSKRQRLVVEEFFFGEKRLADIGRMIGVNADAARMIKSRAQVRLRALLGERA